MSPPFESPAQQFLSMRQRMIVLIEVAGNILHREEKGVPLQKELEIFELQLCYLISGTATNSTFV